MRTTVKVEGLAELEAALAELPKAVGRRVLHKVLRKAAEPMRQKAAELAPKDTGALSRAIMISTKLNNSIGDAEYSDVLRSGGTKAQAVSAMRDARRAAMGTGALSYAEVYMGPVKGSKRMAIKANVQEFGSVKQQPQSFMRPAWDAHKGQALEIIKSELGTEIDAAAKRLAKRRAAAAAKASAK